MAAKTKNNDAVAGVIGREREIAQLGHALRLGRNLLIEGPVGVGKTFLVQQCLRREKRGFERVDGDARYTEQKLTGWFDPPLVLKKGYVADCFIEGPLVAAMRQGRVLFINELNRMPEAVQNILLPAMDERFIQIPKIGTIEARSGFSVVATQNPREFTATHSLSEALLDRFEMLHLDYQTSDEEEAILAGELEAGFDPGVIAQTVALVRSTRQHAAIKRGASVRAALAICKLHQGGMDYETACLMALPGRMEMVSSEDDPREIIRQLLASPTLTGFEEKKKGRRP